MRAAVCLAVCVAAIVSMEGMAQTAPAFEVVSIKPSDPYTDKGALLTYPGGRIHCGMCTLKVMIEYALELQNFQISGGPGWVYTDMYEVDAKPPASPEPGYPGNGSTLNAGQRQMLLTLLKDRFDLKFRRETARGSVYILARGTKALKLKTPEDRSSVPDVSSPHKGLIRGDGIAARNISMAELATELSYYFARPVLDQTGIKGAFDFRYDYVSDDPHPNVVATIIASLDEIGLKVKTGKGPVETFAIDRAERPSPN